MRLDSAAQTTSPSKYKASSIYSLLPTPVWLYPQAPQSGDLRSSRSCQCGSKTATEALASTSSHLIKP